MKTFTHQPATSDPEQVEQVGGQVAAGEVRDGDRVDRRDAHRGRR
jgi:hypothetical protein